MGIAYAIGGCINNYAVRENGSEFFTSLLIYITGMDIKIIKHITHKIKQKINCSMFHALCSMKMGYTLIEVLVAISIFTITIAVPSGFLVSSIRSQRKILASQELVSSASYTLEYISKALRMAKKEINCTGHSEGLDTPSDCSCLTTNGWGFNYEITREGKGVRFINYEDICEEFFWDTTDNRLKEIKGIGAESVVLTPDELEVVSFSTGFTDSWGQNEDKQARVTLFLAVKAKNLVSFGSEPEIKVQTTISQRNLDVTY